MCRHFDVIEIFFFIVKFGVEFKQGPRVTLFKFYHFQSSARLTKRVTGQHAILFFIYFEFFLEHRRWLCLVSLKIHYVKKRLFVTSNLRYMHRVLNVDEIKN
jgi:hypothetical protein